MASSRKRPRVEVDDRAECPFSIRVVDPDVKDKKKKRRKMTTIAEEADGAKKPQIQLSPFSPTGVFKTKVAEDNDATARENPNKKGPLDIHYVVEPSPKWISMTRYNSFVLNGIKYFSEGFIYVANESSVERQRALANSQPIHRRKKADDDWVARILEIRASDEHHVYARVYWMYWPDELPAGTQDGRRTVSGRQPYHGINELIASNHMDVINVVSVTAPATVKQWYEESDEEMQNALYWRQAFDVRNYELSSVEKICSCATPANPDKMLVGCSSDVCKKWMHEQCILDGALKATYDRLGVDKPHAHANPVKNDTKQEAKRPISPTETSAATSAQHSIDVKSDHIDGQGSVEVKEPEDEGAQPAPNDSTADASANPSTPAVIKTEAATTTQASSAKATPGSGRKPGRPRKKTVDARPWEGLFDVTLNMQATPPLLEFEDLRTGIKGGDKRWTAPVICLICGTKLN